MNHYNMSAEKCLKYPLVIKKSNKYVIYKTYKQLLLTIILLFRSEPFPNRLTGDP